ncbi:fasciclin domain-containing protein [Haloglomus litoreum]|uniref:fasciclin domain-containing protein n=1 Tax=Haloglomus litoreum TaxID=3034026 RepID=UPI0023E7A461|nr:fasciclin domain-containing protein [Haloglomus sp. DT116]
MTRTDRRSVLKSLGVGTALLVGGVGLAGARGRPEGRPRQGASAPATVFELAEGSDDFDILELALEETGLDSVLDGDGQYTVFAPTDAAFAELLDALGIGAGDLLADPDLADILLYHVTEGRRYAASVVRAPEVEMLAGGTVAVDGTTLNAGQDPGEAEIVGTNIEASNGVVHVIDGVLLP